MSSEAPAISLRGVGKAYRRYRRPQDRLWQLLFRDRRRFFEAFEALRDVSLEVGRGECVGVVGPNGAGKSTLLQIVAGTLPPTTGQVSVHGRVAPLLELGSGFDPQFTGRENARLGAAILGVPGGEIARRIEDIAAFAELGDFFDQPLASYSSGMAMRLAFAVAISIEPDVLLIDEALAVGDVGFQHKCAAHLDSLRARGVTLLLVSHDLMRLKSQCDRLVYLRDGAVREIGAPEPVAETYLRETLAKRQGADFAIREREPLARPAEVRFGSRGGEITSVAVRPLGETASGRLELGAPFEVLISARVEDALRNPDLFFQIRDTRGYVVYGWDSVGAGIKLKAPGDVAVAFSLDGRLAPGAYSLTATLTDRLGEHDKLLLDKVVGAAAFEVEAPKPCDWQGVVDLGARCREIEAAELESP